MDPQATSSVEPPAPPPAATAPLPPHARLIVFALWLMVFSSGTQVMMISPIFPRIREQLGIPEYALGTLVTVDALALGLVALIAGPISDRIGRRRILLFGTGLMALALALHGFAVDYPSLLVLRALAGSAGGVLSGAAVAYIGDYFPYQRRGWASGWVMTGMAFGNIIGIPAGTIVAAHFGFRAAYLVFGATMLAAFLLVWRAVPQPHVEGERHPLSVRSALSRYRDMLAQPAIRAAVTVFMLTFLGNALFVIYMPSWLEQSVGVSAEQVASLFLVGGIANVFAGPRAGHLSDRIGRKGMIMIAGLGLSVVVFGGPFLVRGYIGALTFFTLVMILFATRVAPFQALLTQLVPGERRGMLMSLTVGAGQLGFAAGGGIAAATYERWGYAASTSASAAIILLSTVIVWLWLPEPQAR